MEHNKEKIAYFTDFKEDFGRNEILCNKNQTNISAGKEYLETVIENNETSCSSEKKSYYCFYQDSYQ